FASHRFPPTSPSRRARSSATLFEARHQLPQRQLVAVRPKTTHHGSRTTGKHGTVSCRLTSEDVGEVDFDVRQRNSRECIAQCETRVGERTGVDYRTVSRPT